MKTSILSLTTILLLSCIQLSFAQDSYKKRYYVKNDIIYDSEVFNNKKKSHTTKLQVLGGLKIDPTISTLINRTSRSVLGIRNWFSSPNGLKANVKFKDDSSDTLFVNLWLVKESESDSIIHQNKIYFYKLNNRQSIKLPFRQWSFNALTVPLKVRFGEDVEFSSDANIGALFGYTWGRTNFVHRKKVGNKQFDTKKTLGLFFGISDDINFTSDKGGVTEREVNTAAFSIGLGYLISYQKFTFGMTSGFDFGLGKIGSEWDSQGQLWLGVSLGYSLFGF